MRTLFSGSYSASTGSNCYVFANGNAGCGVRTNAPNNYGPAFNKNDGGWCVEGPSSPRSGYRA